MGYQRQDPEGGRRGRGVDVWGGWVWEGGVGVVVQERRSVGGVG